MMEKELPEGWSIASVENLIPNDGLFNDGDWIESKDQDQNGEVRLIQLADIGDGEFKDKSARFLTLTKAYQLNCTFLQPDDLLIARMPDPLGRTCIFPLNGLYVTVVDIAIIRCGQNGVFNKWLMYILNSSQIRGKISELSSGSTRLRISRKNLASIGLPLPPLAEQKRIVAKLDMAFGYLETLKASLARIPELLKTFRQSVLTQAVTGKLTEDWRKENKLSDKWKEELAKDCCVKVQSGGTPKSGFTNEGIPFLKVYNIVNQKIDFDYRSQYISEEAHNNSMKKSILIPGDVVMNIVGPPLNKIALVPNTFAEWNHNQAITLFRTKPYLLNTFLYHFFCEGTSVKSLYNETKGVVGQVNISLSQCREFKIPIPSTDEQKEIVNRIEALFAKVDIIEVQYLALKEKIKKLPQTMLAKAFRGELVTQDFNDEPAAMLLKRIKSTTLKNKSRENQKSLDF
ncbi:MULTISPECIES: restriction endonuclease subunit S [Dyadobacter]|uniref:Restriction endonuclease subunit S n=1 Tax=Dyadobacter pollutisoli TaxID=2910158 RepID=A0A9E8NEQ6_9BACT|nr:MULTISPECIES: restriction endonuclease subunit S [Dyadobacter]WAC12957.1 restriction endonuclease subunit S [Dyadobacter pollutisoli]